MCHSSNSSKSSSLDTLLSSSAPNSFSYMSSRSFALASCHPADRYLQRLHHHDETNRLACMSLLAPAALRARKRRDAPRLLSAKVGVRRKRVQRAAASDQVTHHDLENMRKRMRAGAAAVEDDIRVRLMTMMKMQIAQGALQTSPAQMRRAGVSART